MDTEQDNAAQPHKITQQMIQAGLDYFEDTGINSLTSRTACPDFVVGFIEAVESARLSPSRPLRVAAVETPQTGRTRRQSVPVGS